MIIAPPPKRAVLIFALTSCLGVLFVFKYFNFFAQSFTDILGIFSIKLHPVTLKLLLPVGISFYTFQTLSYVIDVYKGKVKAERHFGIYATFISFFPQLVAGPIERTNNLLPQIKAKHEFNYEQATYGLKLMSWGFFKKIAIADALAAHVDIVFSNVHEFQGFALILVMFFFTIQIYCDFSGYSDIARGTAKLFGIELMENFKSPYFSSNVHEFWSRWHISLSTWFRDYIYIPLGGNRVGKLRHKINLMLTFILSGLWHGANWTFIIWGMIHGFAQIITTKSRQNNMKWFKIFITFTFCVIAWLFFRAQTLSDALYFFPNMFTGISETVNYLHYGFKSIGMGKFQFLIFCINFSVLCLYDYFQLKFDVIARITSLKKPFVRYAIYFGFVTLCIMFRSVNNTEFVYFQF